MAENQKVVIGAQIKLETAQAQENMGQLRKALKTARDGFLAAQEEFGEFSQEAQRAAKYVAELKDKVGDANSLIDAFNPDRKFQAFGQSVQGVVGGFTALQGVMGLLGSESEETQKMLLKVQSALAISQGLDDIREAQQGFKNLGAMISQSTVFIKLNEVANKAAAFSMRLFGVSVESTSTSFKVLKGAIAATGIGVLILLVGEAISLFNDMSSAAERAAEAQKKAFAAADRGNDADLQGRLDFIDKIEKLDESRLKAAGASEEAITQNRLSAIRRRIAALEDLSREEGISEGKRNERLKALDEERTNLEIATNEAIGASREKAQRHKEKVNQKEINEEKRRREELMKEAIALNKQLGQENDVTAAGGGQASELVKLQQEYDAKAEILKAGGQSLVELDQWMFDQRAAIAKKYRDEEVHKAYETVVAKMDAEKAAEEAHNKQVQANYQSRLQAFATFAADETMSANSRREFLNGVEQQILGDTSLAEEQRTALLAALSQARITIDDQEAKAKQDNLQLVSNLANAAAQLAGQQTAAGKALAVAATTIDTYMAAQKAYSSQFLPVPESSSPIRGTIAAAAAIASGLARVKSILSVKIPGSASGGGAPGSAVSTAAPLSPSVATTRTRIDNESVNNLSNRAIRSYVVERDVSGQQERIREINRRARLGP